MPKFAFSTSHYITKMVLTIFYHISFKCLFDYAELKRYDDLPKQT